MRSIEERLQSKQVAKVEKLTRKQEHLRMHSELVHSKMQAVREMAATINNEVIQRDLLKMHTILKNRVITTTTTI